MKKSIYLIRHGQTDWNVSKRYQGTTDIPLNEAGIAQAEQLGKRMGKIPVEIVYTSPLVRAYETAKIIGGYSKASVVAVDNFREIDFGEWEGQKVDEMETLYGEAYTSFASAPHQYPFPGEGRLDLVAKRAMKAFDEIMARDSHNNMAIVAHGGILKVMLLEIMGFGLQHYRDIWLDNTSVSHIQYGKGRYLLRGLNDVSHLDTYSI